MAQKAVTLRMAEVSINKIQQTIVFHPFLKLSKVYTLILHEIELMFPKQAKYKYLSLGD